AVEQEAPVRLLSGGGPRRMVRVGQRQRGAVVDRWQSAPEQDLALQFQLLRGLVAAIDAARLEQSCEFSFVKRRPCGLPLLTVGNEAQPGEVLADRCDVFLAAAFGIGIV